MTGTSKNPYWGMAVEELRKVFLSKNYFGMTIKELECADHMLAYMLRKKVSGVALLDLFYNDGLMTRIYRPKNYFSNLLPENAIELVRESFNGFTPNQLAQADASLLMYLEKTRLGEKTLVNILLEQGILVKGSKSHSKKEGVERKYPKWETLTAGYKSFREYLPHYVSRARH